MTSQVMHDKYPTKNGFVVLIYVNASDEKKVDDMAEFLYQSLLTKYPSHTVRKGRTSFRENQGEFGSRIEVIIPQTNLENGLREMKKDANKRC